MSRDLFGNLGYGYYKVKGNRLPETRQIISHLSTNGKSHSKIYKKGGGHCSISPLKRKISCENQHAVSFSILTTSMGDNLVRFR